MKRTPKNNPKIRRKPSARRVHRRNSRPVSKNMPVWVRNVLALAIVFLFSSFFYFFFVRPYAYRWKPCFGQKGYGVCMPYGYKIHGIDISHYQGNIDWTTLATNKLSRFPIHFIFMKATEGGDLDDHTFADNFELAHQHGFIRGAYHFFSPSTDIIKQADFYIENVKLKPGDLPPVLDVEVVGKNSTNQLQEKVKYWLTRIEKHYGVKPVIYASYKFKMRYLNDPFFDDYPYWIAHYYVDSVRYTGKWYFWQHSDRGEVPGIYEDVDLNVFNGTLEELNKLLIKN